MSNTPRIPGFEQQDVFPGSFKYTPIEALRNLFVGFLQGLFGAAPVGCYHWEEDRQITQIIIQDEAPVQEETLQQRPLLVITRGPLQFYSFGMDDLLEYDAAINRKTKSILVPGTITINCCSRASIEAENIAWVVGEHIWLLRDILIQHGLFDTGRQIQIGAPTPAGSLIADDNGNKWVAVSVSVPFQFVRTSARTPLGDAIVQNIVNRVDMKFPKQSGTGGPPQYNSHEQNLNVTTRPAPTLIDAPDARGGTASFSQKSNFLPKQRHPLDPSLEVTVRTVRPYRPGVRPNYTAPTGSVPIPYPGVEESNK